MGRFAVTEGEFGVFLKATGYKLVSCGRGAVRDFESDKPRHPIGCVTWQDAKAYVSWLLLMTGKTYRLLSESEREYVTRAGTSTAFWVGNTISASQANYYRTSDGGGSTVRVDAFSANPWGLYNVHGNVWEWIEDCWNEATDDNPRDGKALTSGDCSRRVLRGGSYNSISRNLRSASRLKSLPSGTDMAVGFRVARDIAP